MKKTAIILLFALLTFALASCSQNNKKPGENTAAPAQPSAGQAEPAPQMTMKPRPIIPIPDEILKAYAGIVISVIDKHTGAVSTQKIGFNTPTKVENTPFSIEVLQFFPDFTMNDSGYFTKSNEPINPAARVRITEGTSTEFEGVFFREYPEYHSLDNPDYGIILADVIKR